MNKKKYVGVSASALYKNSNRNILDQIISGITRQIDAKINTAHHSGDNTIVYDLPVVFDILGLSKQEAQLIIYSDLLKIYGTPEPIGKGFKVEFTVTPQPCLRIGWTNGLTDQEKNEREQILRNYM